MCVCVLVSDCYIISVLIVLSEVCVFVCVIVVGVMYVKMYSGVLFCVVFMVTNYILVLFEC